MARIRSLKPEFWSSEQIVECSPNARLLFIGLWTFSDDAGIHPASLARLKMEVFPGDAFSAADIGEMVDELAAAGLIDRYEVGDRKFLSVTGWPRHQKIDQPTYRYPLPDGSIPSKVRRRAVEDSPNVRLTLDERSVRERSGEEWKKEESPYGDSSTAAARRVNASGHDDCPHDKIIDLYHELLPSLRRVRDWTPARRKLLRARWREKLERQVLEWWREFFAFVGGCDFLMGRTDARGSKPFEADLEWLIKPSNFVKIIEGRYQNSEAA